MSQVFKLCLLKEKPVLFTVSLFMFEFIIISYRLASFPGCLPNSVPENEKFPNHVKNEKEISLLPLIWNSFKHCDD